MGDFANCQTVLVKVADDEVDDDSADDDVDEDAENDVDDSFL